MPTDAAGSGATCRKLQILQARFFPFLGDRRFLAYLVRQKAGEHRIPIGTLDSITGNIKRIESGYVRNPSAIYRNLPCAVLDKTQADLFGILASHYQCDNSPNLRSNDVAFALAGELAKILSGTQLKLSGAAAQLRARSAGRIWDSERLSLAALADRIGVSKARADQLIRSVKKQHGKENPQ